MADWKCPNCGWVNRDFSEQCLSCGHERGAAAPSGQPTDPASWSTPWAYGGDPSTTAAPQPATDWQPMGGPQQIVGPQPMAGPQQAMAGATAAQYFEAPPAEPFGVTHLWRGILAAAAVAVVASALWYAVVAFSGYQIAYVAAAVGWLIGSAAVWGAHGRGSVWLSAVSVVLTILALGVSEYLIAYHVATSELGLSISLLRPLSEIVDIVVEVATQDPLTLAFWAVAVGLAAYIPFKAIRQTASYPG